MDKLPYKKARMLSYWRNMPTTHKPASYDIENYGSALTNVVNEFIEQDLIRISTQYENLERALVSDLKKCLKAVGGKTSGDKNELYQRILDICTAEQIQQFFNESRYILTESGEQQLKNNSLYFKNDKCNLGLTIFELKQLKSENPSYSDSQILTIALNNKITQNFEQKKWRNYFWYLHNLYSLKIEDEDYLEAIKYLWTALYYNLSGLSQYGDNESHIDDFKYTSIDPSVVKGFDVCIDNLLWDLDDFKDYIINICFPLTPTLPFHYFTKEIVLNIICDKLMGTDFSPITCRYPHFEPKEDDKNYIYYKSSDNDIQTPDKVKSDFANQLTIMSKDIFSVLNNNNILLCKMKDINLQNNGAYLYIQLHNKDDATKVEGVVTEIAETIHSNHVCLKDTHNLPEICLYVELPENIQILYDEFLNK